MAPFCTLLVITLFCMAPIRLEAKPVSPDFVELAKKLNPTVVNIRTIKQIKARPGRRINPFTENDPFNELFGRFFNQQAPQQPRKQQGMGTGFIISSDGYILTNNHVVGGADEVMVKLSDGRELKAEIKGLDEKLDVALIKLNNGSEKFPFAELGNSDALEVGEWVMAIGNPFGLGHTVTAGIVSAKGRIIGSGPYDDYIQTDASINPGNSGGPLFNSEGKVIGINTAIIAGGQGIGFAIPINMAKAVAEQLKATGKVVRGYLGVHFEALSPKLAESLGLKSDKGVIITHIEKGSPADKAGFKVEDVIVQYDGHQVNAEIDLPKLVAATPVGKTVKVTVLRKTKRLELSVTVAQAKDNATSPGTPATASIGISVRELTPELARQLGLKDTKGVVVSEVKSGSSAEDAGLVQGDLILEFNGHTVDSLDAFAALAAKVAKGDLVRLLLRRPDGNFGYVAVTAE